MKMRQQAARHDAPGLLVVAHGTRDERGRSEFAELVRAIGVIARETIVEGCFLELVEPDITSAAQRAVDRGARTLVAVPLLLFDAGHAKRDIPEEIASAQARIPGLTIRQMPHLGTHRAVLELAHRRYLESLEKYPPAPLDDTLLLVVGRGTRDPIANAELCHFARRRWEQTHVGWLETCFLAMTEPSLDRALEIVTQLPFSRIAVEPHFLFQGELLDRARNMVAQAAERSATKEFVIADRLGPDNVLAQAVVELARTHQARH